jgi:hypothetical protein
VEPRLYDVSARRACTGSTGSRCCITPPTQAQTTPPIHCSTYVQSATPLQCTHRSSTTPPYTEHDPHTQAHTHAHTRPGTHARTHTALPSAAGRGRGTCGPVGTQPPASTHAHGIALLPAAPHVRCCMPMPCAYLYGERAPTCTAHVRVPVRRKCAYLYGDAPLLRRLLRRRVLGLPSRHKSAGQSARPCSASRPGQPGRVSWATPACGESRRPRLLVYSAQSDRPAAHTRPAAHIRPV